MADPKELGLGARLEALAERWEEERERYRGGGGVYQGVHNALGTCAMQLREALSGQTQREHTEPPEKNTPSGSVATQSPSPAPTLATEAPTGARKGWEAVDKVDAFLEQHGGVASVSELAILLDEDEGRIRRWARDNGVRRLGSTFCFASVLATTMVEAFAAADAAEATEVAEAETELREPVRWFAREMERKLALHDDRPGWEDADVDWLFERLVEECYELQSALRSAQPLSAILSESADVANFAMMIADAIRKQVSDD